MANNLKFATSVIIFSIILVAAVLGFSVMSESGHIMVGCFGSLPGTGCALLSPIAHFAAHLNTFYHISTAAMRSLLLFALLLILALAIAAPRPRREDASPRYFIPRRRSGFLALQHIQLTRWLALHEKRDPSLAFAMNR